MYDVFKQRLAGLNDISQKAVTNDNFVKLQRIQDAIIDDHNDGKLNEAEKHSLNLTSNVIADNMRKRLIHSRNSVRR